MKKICLTLPTNRACSAMLRAITAEAAYAAEHFDVEVHLLVLDSSDEETYARHAQTLNGTSPTPANVLLHHLNESDQQYFLKALIINSGVAKPDHILDLMLPTGVSYGACTNRAFLIATALGCESIHRRDSDSDYQELNGAPIYPIQQELASLGTCGFDAIRTTTESTLDPAYAHRPVVLVGSSFVGELSVDISEIQQLNPEVYHDVVSLWAPADWSDEQKRDLVDESFRGAGMDKFERDHSTLAIVDPMRIDMCNVSFHRSVYERVPLLPAIDTIGSDYFLLHAIYDSKLPGVVHNRNIVNFYTGERRTDAGFVAYQLRFAKFFLSMLYLNFIYDRMAAAGETLLDEHQHQHLRADAIAALARESAGLDQDENVRRLEVLDRSYRKLGGRYAEFAGFLAERAPALLYEARVDIEDFALLTEVWEHLVRAARSAAAELPSPASAPGALPCP